MEPTHQPLSSMTTVEWLTFSGGPSDNILRFAKAVHQFAFAHGRQKDGVWMADYVYGCLDDEALEWFEDLEPKIREDWTHLRSAMMKEFRQSKFVPTAPPAAMGPRVVVPSSTAHARVKIINKEDKVVGYVGPLNEAGINVIQQNSEGALVLEIPLMQPLTQVGASVRIVASGTKAESSYPFVGIKLEYDGYWALRACAAGPGGDGRARPSTTIAGQDAHSEIWSIRELDGSREELYIRCPTKRGIELLQPWVYNDHSFWISKGQLLGGECMKFVLERF